MITPAEALCSHEHGCSCPRCRAREQRDARMASVGAAEQRARIDAAVRREHSRRGVKAPVRAVASIP